MSVEESDDCIHVRVRRLIIRMIDEYVTTYKKPIRRKKLHELVITTDEKIAKLYEGHKAMVDEVFSFNLSQMVREGRVVKVKDPYKPKWTYYVLPKHLEMFKKPS